MTVKKIKKIINIIVATILVLIRLYVITFVMFVFVIPIIHYHWYDVDKLRQFVSDENKKCDQFVSLRLHTVGPFDSIAIYGRVENKELEEAVDDEELEELKEDVMMLKEDVENYVMDHYHKLSDKPIRIYIGGEGISIEMENDVNANPPYALKFTKFRVNGENISESLNNEMNAY
ncbi:MAG: hypothetical protein E7499_06890 [Ruminococcus sp.]|nr:hypothetical protein [Ruminococcus sp.]